MSTHLSDRNREIVRLHEEEGLTLADVARIFGVTRERVRQIVSAELGGTLTRKRWADERLAREVERTIDRRRRREERMKYRYSLAFLQDNSEADENGCWLWTGARTNGYGHLTRGLGNGYAHRHAWSIANRRVVPKGMHVCHKCDVRECVNPAHLFVGTPSDNIRDAIAKGRHIASPLHPDHHRCFGGLKAAA